MKNLKIYTTAQLFKTVSKHILQVHCEYMA